MSVLEFDKNQLGNLEYALRREMLSTNRAGGYMSTTIVCCNTRKYHGLFVGPVREGDEHDYVMLSSLDETVVQHDHSFNLALHRFPDIGVELIIADQIEPDSQVRILDRMDLNVTETDGSLVRYAVNSIPTFPGSFDVAIRVYPKNDLLPHRMDFALVKWA